MIIFLLPLDATMKTQMGDSAASGGETDGGSKKEKKQKKKKKGKKICDWFPFKIRSNASRLFQRSF